MDSLDYYNKYANRYFESTVDLDMEATVKKFIALLPEGGSILDLGCGSGRDSLYFIEQGFDVTALDGSEELCELASIHIGQDVLNMKYSEIDFKKVFDGVWACASLVHLPDEEIDGILNKITTGLKEEGILYMSFRHGDFSGFRNERYYNDYNTKKLKELIERHTELEILDIFKTSDVRSDKKEKVWINILVRKKIESE